MLVRHTSIGIITIFQNWVTCESLLKHFPFETVRELICRNFNYLLFPSSP